MERASAYFVAGIVFLAAGVALGGAGWVLVWPAASCLTAGAAYVGAGARVFGKRPDGRMSPAAVVVLLPLLLATWWLWRLRRLADRTPLCHRVAPGLWLGRRPLPGELPEGVRTVADLTCEFPEPAQVVAGRRYLCLPTLDGSAPDGPSLLRLVEELQHSPGDAYVHCAAGRGRSVLVAAAVLIRRGLATGTDEALEQLRRVRPGARLNGRQRRFLDRLLDGIRPEGQGATEEQP